MADTTDEQEDLIQDDEQKDEEIKQGEEQKADPQEDEFDESILSRGFSYQDDDADESKVDEDEEQKFIKAAERATRPVIEKLERQANEAELKSVFAEFPEFKASEKTVRKLMADQKYKNLSIRALALSVNESKLAEIYASRAREADAKSKRSSSGGGTVRQTETESSVPDVWKLSPKEFKAVADKAKRGGFLP